MPVVQDNPNDGPAWPNDQPTVGNVSVAEWKGNWFMTYDGGRQSEDTTGIYFSYAADPWGPWSKPQLIFQAQRDHGFGVFIHDKSDNPPGPAGPMIGKNPDYQKERGGPFAPLLIERFTRVEGDTLKIYYTMGTWNPYTVVKMRSEFKINHLE